MKKEWIKLRLYFLGILFLITSCIVYFWINLDFLFSTIEPESMMWYQFSQLKDKPYYEFIYLYILVGSIIGVAQFLPEIIKNRIKIMIHLPQKLSSILFVHLVVGILFVFILTLILSTLMVIIIYTYYPSIVLPILCRDIVFYTFTSLVVYILISSVVLEKKLFVSIIKFLIIALFLIGFIKEQFLDSDFLWIILLVYAPLLALDSFYSRKQQRLESLFFKIFILFITLFIFTHNYFTYTESYKKVFNKYYIFYSNVAKNFVYQKNFGDHHFEYGIKDKEIFTQEKYEVFLPFVYWKNLDIQGKLPIKVSDELYTKDEIKKSRLGFNYHPRKLNKQEFNLYPLFNPQRNKGVIRFPEEMFSSNESEIIIYNYDDGISKELSVEINEILNKQNVKFPLLNIWGKATNMKPYDQGYLIEDSNHDLFNLKRDNNKFFVKKINYPNDINIVYIGISENKQKLLSGYAIDKNNNFYLLTWNFKFVKLHTPNFKHKTMKLKLISSPINYLIRYDDGKNYFAVVYDKEFKLISKVKFE
jgi:hypothetical protein